MARGKLVNAHRGPLPALGAGEQSRPGDAQPEGFGLVSTLYFCGRRVTRKLIDSPSRVEAGLCMTQTDRDGNGIVYDAAGSVTES
jgi:hypothetical protein